MGIVSLRIPTRELDGADGNFGSAYKPEMPYVLQMRLIIAASPRKAMTLSQVRTRHHAR